MRMNMAFLMPVVVLLLAITTCHGGYVFVAPKVLRPGRQVYISVTLNQPRSPVDVTAQLVNKKTKGVIVSNVKTFGSSSSTSSISLQVPQNTPSGTVMLRVSGTGGLSFKNETDIKIDRKSISVFIQLDKPIYKPGQKVQFRVFAVRPDLTPVTSGIVKIEIFDKDNNKIKQWLNESLSPATQGVISKKLQLSDQPVLGDWTLKVAINNAEPEIKIFTIDEYVLPKFEVTVSVPSYKLLTDPTLSVKVEAKYTYGKPVKGVYSVTARRMYPYGGYDVNFRPIMKQKQVSESSGGDFSFSTGDLGLNTDSRDESIVEISAEVTETLTGNKLDGKNTVKFYNYDIKMEFLDSTPDSFKPGMMYTAYLKVTQPDGQPLTFKQVTITFTNTFIEEESVESRKRIQRKEDTELTVPQNGLVKVDIKIPANLVELTLKASYSPANDKTKTYQKSKYGIKKFKTRDAADREGIQVSISGSTSIKTGDNVTFDVKLISTDAITSFIYQIICKGNIVKTAQQTINNGIATFSFPVTYDMAPNSRILVFYITRDGEIIADGLEFGVEGLFKNKVSISASPESVKPGDEVTVEVGASPQSYVCLLAIDQSVLLLKSGNDITQQQVIEEMQTYDPSEKEPSWGGCRGCPVMMERRRRKRSFMWPPYFSGGDDSSTIIKNARVVVMTGFYIHQERDRMLEMEDGIFNMANGAGGAVPMPVAPEANQRADTQDKTSSNELKQVDRIRKDFSETMLWKETATGANGKAEVKTKAPDSITSWVLSAFALHSVDGAGVASPTKIRVFKDFFIQLNLPYSVIQGEEFELQAVVFNYMAAEQQAYVTLSKNEHIKTRKVNDIEAKPLDTDAFVEIVVPANSGKVASFWIVTEKIGTVVLSVSARTTQAADALSRNLLVEPEGEQKDYVKVVMIEKTDANTPAFSKTIPVVFPEGLVPGSERVEVSAVGDIMGPSLNGLDKLIRQPTGCGEQTMLSFAPNIFILKYLEATNQLTPDINDKSHRFMESGYQRELTYKHPDGSFSAFGKRDKSGSMWLTAFVIKSFHQAKLYITIDDNIILKALTWMYNKQSRDGSFSEPGRVIHTEMQGGSAKGVSLSAYVLIAFLENQDVSGDQRQLRAAIATATTYLEGKLDSTNDTYTLCIMTYALTLADSTRKGDAMSKLNNAATVKDGLMYWAKPSKPIGHSKVMPGLFKQPSEQAAAASIESTAYALLSYVASGNVKGGIPIMKWLVSQRNKYGGFSSTQDTVLGLQALTEFAALTVSSGLDMTVSLASKNNDFSHNFDKITKSNAILYQYVVVPPSVSSIEITATGNGIAVVTVSVQYNVKKTTAEPVYQLQVKTKDKTINEQEIVACASYNGDGDSGMAMMELNLQSGMTADAKEVSRQSVNNAELQRVEASPKGLALYFNQINQTNACVTVTARRAFAVANPKQALVRLYSYYTPENGVTNFYSSEMQQTVKMCDVCVDCDCPIAATIPPVGSAPLASPVGFLLMFLFSALFSLIFIV